MASPKSVCDRCCHPYLRHPSTRVAGLGGCARCQVPGCNCSGYRKPKYHQRARTRRIPDLCPSCARGEHEHANGGRKCLSWVLPEPRNWTCRCDLYAEEGAPNPFVRAMVPGRPLTREEIAEIYDAEGAEL